MLLSMVGTAGVNREEGPAGGVEGRSREKQAPSFRPGIVKVRTERGERSKEKQFEQDRDFSRERFQETEIRGLKWTGGRTEQEREKRWELREGQAVWQVWR
jgi:hypothetical protein